MGAPSTRKCVSVLPALFSQPTDAILIPQVLSIYRSPPTPAHKSACIAALGEVRDPELLRRTMEFVLGKEVKTQDVRNCFSAIAGNSKARRALWELLKREYEPLVKRFAGACSLSSLRTEVIADSASLSDI